jgi:hypothetical protein
MKMVDRLATIVDDRTEAFSRVVRSWQFCPQPNEGIQSSSDLPPLTRPAIQCVCVKPLGRWAGQCQVRNSVFTNPQQRCPETLRPPTTLIFRARQHLKSN